ncbi:MAG: SRPBCC domain-containing protein [Pseudomonadota bacterium]
MSAAEAYAQFLRVNEWWDGNHSWFGRAEGFSIDPRAGGCFCEVAGERSHLHMTVSHVDPGVEVRMIGGLGPLQDLALQGAMVWRFEALPEGGTRIIHSYRVSGYLKDGLTGLAPAVDSVQGIQFSRLVARLQP